MEETWKRLLIRFTGLSWNSGGKDLTFKSTRQPPSAAKDKEFSFRRAVFEGLAPDGGLFHPTETPDLKDLFESLSADISFSDLAEELTFRLFSPEISKVTSRKIIQAAYSFTPELIRLDDSRLLLELFHGPSYAFKDFGACFLSAYMEEFLAKEKREAVILVATSGDTGSAVARAFFRKKNIKVVILYPSGRVSRLQEKQLTVLGDNITALEVKGSFDDCQRMAKEAFMDSGLRKKLTLTSANSINLGRLIPQSFYYIFAYLRLRDELEGDLYFCVPSGNFGNLTAGVYAWQWGLPTAGFIAATNANDVVPDFLQTGIYRPRPSIKTLSNAMDVGDPSNFERLMAVFNNSREEMHSVIYGDAVNDRETLETICSVEQKFGRFICPHTAVGFLAADRFLENGQRPGTQMVVLATAHPAKFPETVKEGTGKEPDMPPGLKEALDLPKQSVLVENDLEALKGVLLSKCL